MSQRQAEEDVVPVPVIRLNAIEVEKFLAKLRERIKESVSTNIVKRDSIGVVTDLEDYLTDLIASTTSDVIISPLISEQVILIDALTMSSAIEKTIMNPIINEMEVEIQSGRVAEFIKQLASYIHIKKICLDALVQILKRRLTHIYINMPPNLRPSLASASIGYEKIE
ncbi:MAG: hypothetical protein QXT64_01850 [Desulfurococcaceae archaeon]